VEAGAIFLPHNVWFSEPVIASRFTCFKINRGRRCRVVERGLMRIVAALSSAFPLQPLFAHVLANLQRAYPLRI